MEAPIRTDAIRSPISVTVALPYLNRTEHLHRVLNQWYAQDYRGPVYVTIADFSNQLSDVDLSRTAVAHAIDTRWNVARAKNIAARSSRSDLLIFSHLEAMVAPDLISSIVSQWDTHDAWFSAGIGRGVPHDPSLDSVVAVKRWVNTRLRGYNEDMMENPHGWGYDDTDYRIRVQALLQSCGGSIGEIGMDRISLLPHTNDDRAAPYEVKDLNRSCAMHEAYSYHYRAAFGVEANIGKDWGLL